MTVVHNNTDMIVMIIFLVFIDAILLEFLWELNRKLSSPQVAL